MGSGCGTFASSSHLGGDTDYSHLPKVGADKQLSPYWSRNNSVDLHA